MTALRCVIDMLHLYGLEEFTEAAEDMNSGAPEILPVTEQTKEDESEEEGGAIISALCQVGTLKLTILATSLQFEPGYIIN